MKSPDTTRTRRIDSARETVELTARTASASAAATVWCSGIALLTSGADAPVAAPPPAGGRSCRKRSTASGSRVSRAPTYGRPLPTTRHWLISGWARSRSSSGPGETFLPPEVTRISFLRPVMVR